MGKSVAKFFIAILAGIIVFSVWGGTYGPLIRDWIQANLRYREAKELYKEGRAGYLEFTVTSFKEAEILLLSALAARPAYAKAHAALGELYSAWTSVAAYRGEDWRPLSEKALDHGLAAIALEPALFESHRSLAAVFTINGHSTLALQEARRALGLRSEDPEAKFWKWIAEGERYDPAYFRAVENDASYNFLLALVRVGFSLNENRKSEAARRFFLRAKALALTNGQEIPLVYVGIGNTYVNDAGPVSSPAHQQLIEKATGEFSRAIELDDQLIIAHLNLGDAYMSGRRWREALSHFESALEIDPAYQIALYNKAMAHYELGEVAHAAKAWKDTAEVISSGVKPRTIAFSKFAEAFRLYHRGQKSQAVHAYQESVEAGHKRKPPMHFDSPQWCDENRMLGPRGLAVISALIARSGIHPH